MYITEVLTTTKKGKASHRCILLRESYRENGKVKNRTITNLTHCNPKEVAALRLALAHKDDLTVLKSFKDNVEIKQGMSVGAAWAVYEIGKQLGVEKALGTERAGKLAFWQVIARVIDQGSRLSSVRLAQIHAGCDILGIRQGFNEEHLYKNLAWLSDNQGAIERRLFEARLKGKKPELFLYDVTSSYLEGLCNELADWGYNRDGKKGKKQVVVGLLCDEWGYPVAVEVFTGNTRDFNTFGSQIKKVARGFGCERVTFVGDRGMIKSGQIKELKDADFSYITAITKPQIDKLLKTGIFQMELFDKEVCEVQHEGVRYILRRNPQRAEEIACIRKEKKETIEKLCQKKNIYLSGHLRAKVKTAVNEVNSKIKRLKIAGWLSVEVNGRVLELKEDKAALAEEGRLDGCYVIKSDLSKDTDKQVIHDRYKDLSEVEEAFRTCKTVMLYLRPWHVWSEKSTRGHALVVMLAYLIIRNLQQSWTDFDLTVKEGLKQLTMLCSIELVVKNNGSCHHIPTPCQTSAKLLEAVNVRLPKVLPHLEANVVSRKKLQTRRISR
ncbi:IS1634 family transposase [Thermodesulfovibrionales bacterium]|nr:IS1634 family transposase [Thermodesulfovibrionales bacterium]